ncbi:hypothetical protein Q9233_000998 [Columba guinea]|nr:hypothetical protein Q9233_000998 [Columba guinea]
MQLNRPALKFGITLKKASSPDQQMGLNILRFVVSSVALVTASPGTLQQCNKRCMGHPNYAIQESERRVFSIPKNETKISQKVVRQFLELGPHNTT